MKILITIFAALIITATNLQSQVVIGKDKTPHTGSVLEINNNSTNKGIIFPKVSLLNTGMWGLAGTDAAEKGMVVYNTNKNILGAGANGEGMYYWDGINWKLMRQDSLIVVDSKGFVEIGGDDKSYRWDGALDIVKTGPGHGDHHDDIAITSYSEDGDIQTTPSLVLNRARGTQASPKPLKKGDLVGSVLFDAKINGSGALADGFSRLWGILSAYQGNGNTDAQDLELRSTGGYMYLDTLGQVGIGTRTPEQKLHVSGNSYVTGNIGIGISNPAYGLQLALGKTLMVGNTPLSGIFYNSNASNDGVMIDNVATQASLYIQRSNNGGNIYLSKNKTLAGGSINNASYIICRSGVTGGALTQIGSITANSTGDGLVYNTTSDKRLKENIVNTRYGLADLMKISVKDYNFKSDENKVAQTGFLAQDLYEVYPDAVTVGGDNAQENPWAVDYGKVTPLLVKSIQDQQKIIESQQKLIEQLEARIKALENK